MKFSIAKHFFIQDSFKNEENCSIDWKPSIENLKNWLGQIYDRLIWLNLIKSIKKSRFSLNASFPLRQNNMIQLKLISQLWHWHLCRFSREKTIFFFAKRITWFFGFFFRIFNEDPEVMSRDYLSWYFIQ